MRLGKNKKGMGLLDALNVPVAVGGIVILMAGFFIYISLEYKEPMEVINEANQRNQGDLFMLNYLRSNTTVGNIDLEVNELLLLYHLSEGIEKDEYKRQIERVTEALLKKTYSRDGENICFALYFENKGEIYVDDDCEEIDIFSESYLPYPDGVLHLSIQGET